MDEVRTVIGPGLLGMSIKLQTDARVWLVGSDGTTRVLDVDEYAALTAAELAGCKAFLSETSAARYVATLKNGSRT